MFYVYDISRTQADQAINIVGAGSNVETFSDDIMTNAIVSEGDVDFVDDALLNTAPHNAIEQQLLRGDMVGLALMSGAILWSAMGAFG